MSTKKTYTNLSEINICSLPVEYSGAQVATTDALTLSFYYKTPSSNTFQYNYQFPIDITDFNKKLLTCQPAFKINNFIGVGKGEKTSIGRPDKLFEFSNDEKLSTNMENLGYRYSHNLSGVYDGWMFEDFYVQVNNDLYYPLYMINQHEKVQNFIYDDAYEPDINTFTTDVPLDKMYRPRGYYIDSKNSCEAYEYSFPIDPGPLWEEYGSGYSYHIPPNGYYTIDFNGSNMVTIYLYGFDTVWPYPLGEIQTFLKTYYLKIDLEFKTNQGFILLKSANYSWDVFDQPTAKIDVTKNEYGLVTDVKHRGYYKGSSTNATWPSSRQVDLCFSITWLCDIIRYKIKQTVNVPNTLTKNTTHRMQCVTKIFDNEEFSVSSNKNSFSIESEEQNYPYIYTGNLEMEKLFDPETTIINSEELNTSELNLQDNLRININNSKQLTTTGKLQLESIKISGQVKIGGD